MIAPRGEHDEVGRNLVLDEKTRVLSALVGGRIDRAPVTAVISSVTQEMMTECRAPWPDGHCDPELMARLGAAAHTMYGLESVKVPFDVVVEAEALGAEVNHGDLNIYPQVVTPVCYDPADLKIPDDFFKRGRVPVVLEAIRLLRHRYGAETVIVSSAMGPLSACGLMFGMSTFMIWMLTEPDKYHRAMEAGTELATMYARAQIEAGSDLIQFGEAAASGSMISPKQYAQNVAPYHRKLVSGVGGLTALHICGNIGGHLEAIASTGATAISLDERVDMAVARQVLKGRMAIIGNVPTERLSRGTPDEIRALSRQALVDGVDLLNAGCSLPTDTPGVNLEAMVEEGRSGLQ